MNTTRVPPIHVQHRQIAAAIVCGLAMTVAASGSAADPDATSLLINWQDLAEHGLIANGEVITLTDPRPFEQEHALKLISPADVREAAATPVIALTTIDSPPITKETFALTGWIKHSGVEGAGYLEMWTVFPDGSQYFSRTLGTTGSTQALNGDSGWRPILLPFQLSNDPQAPKPSRLIVNAVLPGAGELVLSDLALKQADKIAEAATAPGAWWSDQTAGLVGGIGGTLIGLIGAAIGGLTGMGRGKPLVIALLLAMTTGGALALVAGIIALILQQPYGVYYPLLLAGGLCAVLGAVFLAVTPQRFAAIELRRMQALDA